ncbi:hypothetical protein DF186_16660, partial [Enterococcus hirae]
MTHREWNYSLKAGGRALVLGVWTILLLCVVCRALAQQVKLLDRKHDPYGVPRPGRGHEQVPLM